MNYKNVIFGPVPSRRLGFSLGINNIPAKVCSYSCKYCQIGKTTRMRINRKEYYSPSCILESVKSDLAQCFRKDISVDYISFVPDGEPTLDANLGITIELLKSLDIPIAIITNSSLINRKDVQTELELADWISFKVDTVNTNTWQKIDRPHGKLNHESILESMVFFRHRFKGTLVSETMMIDGINDAPAETGQILNYLKKLQPDISYIAIPTRPPADRNIKPANSQSVLSTYHLFSDNLKRVELLTAYEGNNFKSISNIHDDILDIAAVHPIRSDALQKMLQDTHTDWTLIYNMINRGELIKYDYQGYNYYLKAL